VRYAEGLPPIIRLMKYIILVVVFSMFSCSNEPLEKTERPGEPDIINLKSNDIEMNEAIAMARITLIDFNRALNDSLSGNSSFALKLQFQTQNNTEHIWFTEIQLQDSTYSGVLNNVPSHIEGMKMGERRRLNPADISDWMYGQRGELRGGYTIRVLRNRMSKTERELFDADFGLSIKDP
jgi:uncharacterized protein YegJ (DUF2314 family)